ncbi:MAG: Do family serine endopeptidase [Hyphomicrobiaceae bacterium]|nr:MAG: Do family serine endopeptidase [Hyphomicrobiaceae bacterium]
MVERLHLFPRLAPLTKGRAVVLALSLAAAMLSAPLAARGPESLAPIAEPLMPAVVNISTSQSIKGVHGTPLPKSQRGSPFEEFFEEYFNKKEKPSVVPEKKATSLGSGFVIDPSGLIVTNHHVIDGADEIIVSFADGSRLKVEKVIGKDAKSDLALLKVTPKKPLPFVKFGVSETVRVGDWVMVIGNPFGLGGTLTVGVISAKNRDINSGPFDDYLQTDAAINKGNSGGPLFNMKGEVIGVNTAIITAAPGGSSGIGFSIPSDTVARIIEQFKLYGEVRRGWLGVRLQTLTEELAEGLDLGETRGALVAGVSKDSPASKAGLLPRDLITRFAGKPVPSARQLTRQIAQTPIDSSVEIEVERKGKRSTLLVKIGRLIDPDEAEPKVQSTAVEPPAPPRPLLGMMLTPVTEELRQRFSLDKKLAGLVVLEVDPKSFAAQRQIKAGDVVVEAAQEAIGTFDQIAKRIEDVRKTGRNVILLGVTDAKGDFRFVTLPLS